MIVKKIIEDVWRTRTYGCPMYVLDRKLKLLKAKLKDWNKHSFGDVHNLVKKAKHDLKIIQEVIASNGYSNSLQDEESKAQLNLESALCKEDEFWREKSRIKWHSNGDRNTNFFHTYAKIIRKLV